MKIAVIGINYYPELTGIGLYTTEMCEWLAKHGHDITVITGFPFYPQWKVNKEYQGKFYHAEIIKQVKVKRSYVYVPEKVSAKGRIMHELSFGVSSLLNLFLQLKHKPDLIISVCPPAQLGVHGFFLSKVLKVPHIIHVQDLQVDAAADLNMLKNKKMLELLRKIEKFLYQHADMVTTISSGMKERIKAKGISQHKIALFPNWADVKNVKPLRGENNFREVFGISKERFLVLYAGNMGEKQGLDCVLEAVNLLRKVTKIQFLFVGDGAKKDSLLKKTKQLALKNISFLEVQPKEVLPLMLNAADLCLVPQQKTVTNIFMPSKLTNILASGKAVLVSANKNCEVSKIVKKFRCGLVIEPENPQLMAATILEMSQNPVMLKEFAINSRKFAEEHFDSEKILTNFESEIIGLVSRAKGQAKTVKVKDASSVKALVNKI